MAGRYGADRIPWGSAERIVEAFDRAFLEESITPLEAVLRKEQLERLKFVRERQYRFFGKRVRRLPQASVQLALALERERIEFVDIDSAPMTLASTLRGDPSHANARAAILELFANDHGLPAWMAGDEGPSLLSPKEVKRLLETLESVKDQWGAAQAIQPLTQLCAMARRCTPDDGVLIQG